MPALENKPKQAQISDSPSKKIPLHTAGLIYKDFGCCSWPVKCKHLNFNCIIKKKVPTYIFESPWSLLLLQVFANFLQKHSCRNCLEIHNFIWHCKKKKNQKTLFLDKTSMVRIANDCPKIIKRFVLERGYKFNNQFWNHIHTLNFHEFYCTCLMKNHDK